MSDPEEIKLFCIVDRVPRTIIIEKWKTPVAVQGSNFLYNAIRVRIDNQWRNYLLTEMAKMELLIGSHAELLRDWYSDNNLTLLLTRDAVNVFLRNKDSAFTTTLQPKSFLVTENELVNLLVQEAKVSLPADEAKLIDYFLVGYEYSVPITIPLLYVSTGYSYKEIEHKINFFIKRSFINPPVGGEYAIKDASNYDLLELRFDKLQQHQDSYSQSIQNGKSLRYLNPVKPHTNQPIAFVGLPFHLTDHFSAIDAVCSTNGFLAYKIDRDPRFDTFLNKVIGAVLVSKVCIFDVTGFNANVMLELGVAMSTNVDIIVIAEEKGYLDEQSKWESEVKNALSSDNIQKLEKYLKDSKFINLVPSDVRERPVHLFKDVDDLKIKLNNALNKVS
jgi:hypothetical protein